MPADFLQLAGKTIVVFGVANRKSVAWHVARALEEADARVVYVVRSEARREQVQKLAGGADIFVCDVEYPEQIAALAKALAERYDTLHGIVHSIALADYGTQPQPFHEIPRETFFRAFDVSCYSLVALSRALQPLLASDASVVTISIASTRMAAENYGCMSPIKAALESSVVFLAKSFSRFSEVRFNAIAAGVLKTSASAGIPGFVDTYLFAEKATPRKRTLETAEVAAAAAFLLSPRASGINAQTIVADAGMGMNYFDEDIVRRVTRPESLP